MFLSFELWVSMDPTTLCKNLSYREEIYTKIWNQTSYIWSEWKNRVRKMKYESWVWVIDDTQSNS